MTLVMRTKFFLGSLLMLAATACSRDTAVVPGAGAGSASAAVAAPLAAAGPAKTGGGPVWIETVCDDVPATTRIAEIKREHPEAREVAVGQAGVVVESDESQDLTAWDTDSRCSVSIHAPKDADAVALARTILDQLPGNG
jgi:hypothetical protein